MSNLKPVVAINQKGEAIAYYESAMEASRVNGIHVSNLYYAISNGTPCHRFRWMHEKNYRELWMNDRTDELRFSNKELHAERTRKQWENMSEERKKERCRRISERKKEMYQKGIISRNVGAEVRSRPLICYNTGEEYPSVAAFARAIGTQSTYVSKAIRRGKRVKGFVVMYKDGCINKKK